MSPSTEPPQPPQDLLEYLNGRRIISTSKAYAYLKIAEGCDNHCTYCIIPYLRGPYISRKQEDIIKEAKALVESGYKELILIAQDTTKYGNDIYGKPSLDILLTELCKIEGDFRIRIMYCYPDDVTDELIAVMATNDKVCKYMDMPVQHGSDKVLKAMGRRCFSNEVKDKIHKLRKAMPDIFLRTSLITGFPGETEKDHETLKEFIKEIRFDRLGVFEYSKEDGTKAALMPNQIHQKVKEKRHNELMTIQWEISKEINEKRLKKVYDIIIEGSDYGRSYAEAPEIDGLIYFTTQKEHKVGDRVLVEILEVDEYDLKGREV